MRTISKKILSLLLVAVLVLSAVPFAAFADDHNCVEEVIEIYTGIWECSCGKIYRTADCSDTPMTDAEFAAWLEEHFPDNGNSGIAPQSGDTPITIKFKLLLEDKPEDGLSDAAKNGLTYTITRKASDVMPTAPGIGSFTSKVSGQYDLSDYKTNVLIWTTAQDGNGTAYPTDKPSKPSVGSVATGDSITYYALLSWQRINVTVKAEWNDGSAKSYELDRRELKLKDWKDKEIFDYLNTEIIGSRSKSFRDEVNTAVSANPQQFVGGSSGNSDEFSNFGWDGFWYEGSSKITNQKFASKGLNTTYTFTAKLTKNAKSKVTFDPNGGTCSVTTKELNTGAAYGTLPVPSRTDYAPNRIDYVFVGWFDKMPPEDIVLEYNSNGYVKAPNGIKQYFNNTAITEDVTLYAWWAPQADITLYVYNNNAPGANPVDTGKVLGVPVGAKLLRSHITSALTGTTDLFGPFEKNGGKDESTSTWAHYAYYRNGVNVLGKTVDKTEELAVFVNPGRLKDNQNVGINYNVAPGGSSGSGSNGSSGSGSGSSAAADPSNPKTGDAQRTELNVAAISLAVATVALGLMTTVMFVRRKHEA